MALLRRGHSRFKTGKKEGTRDVVCQLLFEGAKLPLERFQLKKKRSRRRPDDFQLAGMNENFDPVCKVDQFTVYHSTF